MCTVTVLPRSLLSSDASDDQVLLRVLCNRDELLTRAPALPPTLWTAGPRRALMPIDPQSGGTWIAANDTGLVFVLLNANDRASAPIGAVSRGTIIPTLVGCGTVSRALTQAQHMRADRFAPFRLLIIDRNEVVDCQPDGDRIRHRRSSLRSAILRTSSGLGDAVVTGPRRALFQRMVIGARNAQAAQNAYHRHQWLGREAISVNMRCLEAATVSRTLVEVREGSVRLSYQAMEWPHSVAVQVAA
jgi:transport and Golgi organization protein 2